MATDRNLDELFNTLGINIDDFSSIELPSPEEATLESVERMITQFSGTARVLSSRGEIHLRGSGVKSNAAPMASVGNLLNQFQCSIDAIGASISGITSTKGSISSIIRERTVINIIASPQPGSLRLNISPSKQGFDEVFPNGETLFGYDDLGKRPLADVAIEELINLLEKVDTESPDNEELIEELTTKGQRVASTFKGLMQSLDEGSFDADLRWCEPDREKRESHITHQLAKYAVSVIENAKIETNERMLYGILLTSTASKKDKIRIRLDEDNDEKTISLGEINPITMDQFHTNDKVIIKAEESIGHHVGGRETVRLTGISIEAQPMLNI